jgi:predicted AAA+ superfamily ATPase
MDNQTLKKIIRESLSKTDENQIGAMIRREIKKSFGEDLESKVMKILEKELKNSKLKKHIVEINKDVLVQLYKELWMRRNMWLTAIK